MYCLTIVIVKMRNENLSIKLSVVGRHLSVNQNWKHHFVPHLKIFKFHVFKQHKHSPTPSFNADSVQARRQKEGCENILFTPTTTSQIFPFHTQTHTQRELFGVDGNEKKKSKPFGSRRRAKAFWGCVKGVRVRICDKKWLYGSCTLKSFSFRKKSMCRS